MQQVRELVIVCVAEFGFPFGFSLFCNYLLLLIVQNMQAKVSSICKHYKPSRVDILNGPTECSNLWKLRKEALWSVQAKVILV